MEAIGRGIGVSAAHEIAHHFLGHCCSMDSNPVSPGEFNPDPNNADPGARGTYNATGCSANSDPSPWTGYWPNPKIDLHWEKPALDALGCLGNKWRNFSGYCHN